MNEAMKQKLKKLAERECWVPTRHAMTDELEKLAPEVAHSVRCVDAEPFSDGAITHWPVVRADLLRLAGYEQAAGRLAVEKAEFRQRAEKAEAELAAMKARIAGSDAGTVTQTFSHLGSDGADTTTVEAYPPKVFHHTAIGQRVRLVVED